MAQWRKATPSNRDQHTPSLWPSPQLAHGPDRAAYHALKRDLAMRAQSTALIEQSRRGLDPLKPFDEMFKLVGGFLANPWALREKTTMIPNAH